MTNEQFAVGPGQVVSMHYSLYKIEHKIGGNLVESTEGREPIVFLYGDRNVLPALQSALNGKMAGDKVQIEIPHNKAYGRHYPDRVQRLPRKRIDNGKHQSFRVGQVIKVDLGQRRNQSASVIKVGKFNLDIDTNHPLAGQDLRFHVIIDHVRPATHSEISHGHV